MMVRKGGNLLNTAKSMTRLKGPFWVAPGLLNWIQRILPASRMELDISWTASLSTAAIVGEVIARLIMAKNV